MSTAHTAAVMGATTGTDPWSPAYFKWDFSVMIFFFSLFAPLLCFLPSLGLPQWSDSRMGICGIFPFLLCGYFLSSLACVSSIYLDCSALTCVKWKRQKAEPPQAGGKRAPSCRTCVCWWWEGETPLGFIFTFGLFAHYPTWFHQFSTSHFVSKKTGPAPSFLVVKFRGRQMSLDEDKLRTCLPQTFLRDVIDRTTGCTSLSMQRTIFDLQPS